MLSAATVHSIKNTIAQPYQQAHIEAHIEAAQQHHAYMMNAMTNANAPRLHVGANPKKVYE